MIEVINPVNGKKIKTYQESSSEEVKRIILKTQAAFEEWRYTDFSKRAELMKNAAEILRDNVDKYAIMMAEEMGKPVKGGRSEVLKCAFLCDYYAEKAEGFLSQQVIETEAAKSYVTFKPLGIVLAVMPWNFPFWQVIRFAAPALMAGNAGLLKHASNVPGTALALEEIFRAAGFPENLFRTLLIGSRQVEAVIENPFVKAVTLTGSTPAGRAVAKKAGEMLKPTVLELGGSDPYLILEDADLPAAASLCATSRLINSGQSCIAAKRFIVIEAVKTEFESLLTKEMKARKIGDPLDEVTEIGPQARFDLRDELDQQVQLSIKLGARCLAGGKIPQNSGAFYPATVLTDVKKGMPAYNEELFGPVASIIGVRDEEEAIKTANDSIFGLGAAVFTRDVKKGERIAADELEAGSCFVNTYVKSDQRLPFGGIKESGYGRELSSFGIKEFVNIKTVYVNSD